MIAPGSRYEESEQQFTERHIYDKYGYPMLENRDNVPRFMLQRQNATYLLTTLPLPPPPPVEYVAKETEHFPFIAFKFMDDSARWWEIAEVNPHVWYPLDLDTNDDDLCDRCANPLPTTLSGQEVACSVCGWIAVSHPEMVLLRIPG